MTGSEHLLDQRDARPATEQLRCSGNALHTIRDGCQPPATMIDEFLLELWRDEVANGSRHPWQHVHYLHARPTANGQPDGLLERRVVRGNGIDVDEDAGEGDHDGCPVRLSEAGSSSELDAFSTACERPTAMVAANRQVKVSARFLLDQFEPDRDDSGGPPRVEIVIILLTCNRRHRRARCWMVLRHYSDDPPRLNRLIGIVRLVPRYIVSR